MPMQPAYMSYCEMRIIARFTHRLAKVLANCRMICITAVEHQHA